jgi:hypothetical protein
MNTLILIAVPIVMTFIITDVIVYPPGYRRARRKAERAARFTRSHWK